MIILNQDILDFYLETSMYTNYIPFQKYYQTLPDDIKKLCDLIHHQIIHRRSLIRSYTGKYAFYENTSEMESIKEQYPWYKNRCDDDILLTASSITAELIRLDQRGFTLDRKIPDKIVLTCRYSAVLLASILKAKHIPARVRSGYCDYMLDEDARGQEYYDHWIVQYYDNQRKQWVNVDASGLYAKTFPYYDFPDSEFQWVAKIWLDVRKGKKDCHNYIHGFGRNSLRNLAQALFFDFHALMNQEMSYMFSPVCLSSEEKFQRFTDAEFSKLDLLAELMLEPDKNFTKLREMYENDSWYRVINTPLVGDNDHLEILENVEV